MHASDHPDTWQSAGCDAPCPIDDWVTLRTLHSSGAARPLTDSSAIPKRCFPSTDDSFAFNDSCGGGVCRGEPNFNDLAGEGSTHADERLALFSAPVPTEYVDDATASAASRSSTCSTAAGPLSPKSICSLCCAHAFAATRRAVASLDCTDASSASAAANSARASVWRLLTALKSWRSWASSTTFAVPSPRPCKSARSRSERRCDNSSPSRKTACCCS
mmetsp:Transcript_132438/g.264253  ORF Transcript_132438/g.264253 Transcript_132438/m.264253 type:complete len:218 (-) Transcript_132438:783-1436(-)